MARKSLPSRQWSCSELAGAASTMLGAVKKEHDQPNDEDALEKDLQLPMPTS